MDPLSQGLTGAVLAQSASKPETIRHATIAGIAGGMLADIDFLIRSSSDPLLHLDFHRHFTHALVFIPLGGLMAALLLWPILRRHTSFAILYLFATLGYATAGFLDACTSYGTHLLWPFSNSRIAWNIISIIDPVYTLILLTGISLAALTYRPKFARVALLLALIYLCIGIAQRDRAQSLMEKTATLRGHTIERSEIKPTMANLLLWRGIYLSNNQYYIDAYRVSLLAENKVYEGETLPLFDTAIQFPHLPIDSIVSMDISRFAHFSDDYLVTHPQKRNVIGDLRYSMLPTSTLPLWGIVINLDDPSQHVTFENFRTITKADRQRFIDMLLGRGCSPTLPCVNLLSHTDNQENFD